MIELKIPCNGLLTAQTMGGKTFLIKKLLKEQILDKIDYLIILSPTLGISGDWDEPEFQENDKPPKGKPIVKKFDKNFAQVIQDCVEQAEEILNHHKRKDMPQIFIILDDMIFNKIVTFKGLVDKLSTKSRHLNISFWLLVQKLTGCPRTFRVNCRYMFMFSCCNYSETEKFLEEYCPQRMKKELKKRLEEIYNQDYAYILCSTYSSSIRDRLWLNGCTNIYDMIMGKGDGGDDKDIGKT